MLRGWKIWSALGALASLTVFGVSAYDQGPSMESSTGWSLSIPGQERFIPWQGKTEAQDEQGAGEAPQEEALWVRLVDGAGQGVEADGMISAPGMWPFILESTEGGGYLRLPENEVERFEGGQTHLYELLARSEVGRSEEVAFWGVIAGPDGAMGAEDARSIELGPARALAVEVVDVAREPVEGAFVRLSRESVGMLHLVMASDEGGRAEFSRIPEGVYYLTIDGDGYARQVARVEHSAVGDGAVEIVLAAGEAMRLPEAWRGPLLSEMIPELEEQEEPEGPEEPEISGAAVTLDIYAADPQGGGVEGAWVEVWSGRRRVAQGMSGGRRALGLKVPEGEDIQVVVTHAGWGEGQRYLSAPDEGDEVVVRMEGPLLSSALPDRVRSPQEMERIFGAPLIADGGRWLLDRPWRAGESAAFDGGLERGDSLLFLRREGAKHRAVVERSGRIVEVVF